MVKSVSQIKLKQSTIQRQKPKYSFASDLINSSGLLTKEDKIRFEQIRQRGETTTLTKIKSELSKRSKYITQFIQSYIKDTKFVSDMLIYNNSEKLSMRFIKKLKSYKIFRDALNINNTERKITLYPTNIEYIPLDNIKKNLSIFTKEPLLSHPTEITAYITGLHSTSSKDKTLLKIHKKRNITSLLNEQEQILQRITNMIKEKGSTQNFTYTNDDIKSLNILITKYYKINDSLKNHGINLNNIETLLFRPLLYNDIQIGDTLPNADIIIDKTKIYDREEKRDISAIMTFANTNMGFRLKIYRYDDLFNKIDEIRKKYKWYKSKKMYYKLNNLNCDCFKIINDSEIAEVFFQEKNAQEMKEILSKDNLLSEDEINQHIKPDEKYIFIRNLKNYNINKYYKVSAPLIKNLKLIIDKNKMESVFINAYAYNNVKHSPAALYLHAGCHPISHTPKEILKMLQEKDKAYDKPILFTYHPQKS